MHTTRFISVKCNGNSPPIAMFINNQRLDFVQRYKYLGLLLVYDLSWFQHIEAKINVQRPEN